MALFTDSFDGTDGTLLSSRTGWTGSSGYYDVLKVNGSGALRHDAYSDDAQSGLNDTGTATHYVKTVVGAGFVASSGGVAILVCATGRGDNVYVRQGSTEVEIGYDNFNAFGGVSGQDFVAGDELEAIWNSTTKFLTVKKNGTQIYNADLTAVAGSKTGTKTGVYLSFAGRSATDDILRSWESNETPAGDTTAPVLTSPTATTTGSTTATGSVTTDEANGTLYRLASTNATETAATVIAAALSQTVTATGAQAVSFTGLTASTTYYAHYVHVDAAANQSARVSSASFTTTTPDTTAPSFGAATLNAGTKTSTSVALSTSAAATDAVGVTGYEWSSDNGATYPFTSLTNSFTFTALTALTSYNFRVRAYDAAGNRSTHLSLTTSTFRNGATGQAIIDDTSAIPGVQEDGILVNDVELPADAAKWFSYEVVTPVADTASLTLFPNGSFIWTGTSADSFTYQLEVDGVDVGSPQLVSLTPAGEGPPPGPTPSNATKRTPNGMIGFWNR